MVDYKDLPPRKKLDRMVNGCRIVAKDVRIREVRDLLIKIAEDLEQLGKELDTEKLK